MVTCHADSRTDATKIWKYDRLATKGGTFVETGRLIEIGTPIKLSDAVELCLSDIFVQGFRKSLKRFSPMLKKNLLETYENLAKKTYEKNLVETYGNLAKQKNMFVVSQGFHKSLRGVSRILKKTS